MTGISGSVELHSLADVPANSGLGSSSSFTVALLNGLHAFKREFVSAEQLAREACQIEIDTLKEPIGKQDQYIAAYGGISAMTFNRDGSVDVERLPLRERSSTNSNRTWSSITRGRAGGVVGPQRAGSLDRREQGRGRSAHAPDQGARPRDEAHSSPANSTSTARCCTSTGPTSASSPPT
jgi:hypothetical protein